MTSGKHNRGLVGVWIAVAAVGLGMGSGWLQHTSAQESVPDVEAASQPIQQLNAPTLDPGQLPSDPPLDLPTQPDPPSESRILEQPRTEAIRSELRLLRQEVLDVLIRIQALEALLDPPLQQQSSTQAEIVSPNADIPDADIPDADISDVEVPEFPPPPTDPAPDLTPESTPTPETTSTPETTPTPESITLNVGTQTISLPGDVLFDFDQAELRPEATSLLQRVANRLNEQQAGRVLVAGHTDDVGEDNYNLVLSLDRANAVKDFLMGAISNANQFNWSSSGYGAAQPIASNDTEVGRQRNRRVDIIIAP